jgi:protein-disulfide isomerase
MGGADRSVAKANEALDSLTKAEGKRQKVDESALAACIAKQDDTAVRASMKLGEELGVDSTPALFINGERVVGAVPMQYVYRAIDNALIASGQTPPPPPPEVPAPTIPSPPATKPGN